MDTKIEQKTWARWNLDFALQDVRSLLNVHDSRTERRRGKPNESLEVLKRSGLILTVSAWETFVEDSLIEQMTKRLENASTPQELLSTFNSVAQAWLTPSTDKKRPKPSDLVSWTGDGWKKMIMDRLRDEVRALNTPDSKNLKPLFDKYLGLKVETAWRWCSVTADDACRKLDTLIALRGNVVHRSKSILPEKSSVRVRRAQLVDAMVLVQNLAQSTEKAMSVAPTSRYV